ncbi:uridylate kinase [Candidatus Dependentiae bacterium Noda2021]|nr:uridylate kinase [Candidatus Dependentiae bacterium Noda2021]
MLPTKKKILLKLTGEIFISPESGKLSNSALLNVINQIIHLRDTHIFGIVIGGGNFFRGTQQGTALGISPSVAHQVGMLATMMNALLIKDLFETHNLPATVLSAVDCPEVGPAISLQTISQALEQEKTIVFAGGTGNPFFTTDTNAILRGLQMEAQEIWKGTHIDGVYDSDPAKNKSAQLIKQVSYATALEKKLAIMDATAFALAATHHQVVRIFSIFEDDALIKAARNPQFGSTIT